MELTREQIAQRYAEKKYDYVSCPESLASHVYTRGWLDCMEYLTEYEPKNFLTLEEVFPEFAEEGEHTMEFGEALAIVIGENVCKCGSKEDTILIDCPTEVCPECLEERE